MTRSGEHSLTIEATSGKAVVPYRTANSSAVDLVLFQTPVSRAFGILLIAFACRCATLLHPAIDILNISPDIPVYYGMRITFPDTPLPSYNMLNHSAPSDRGATADI